MSWIQEGSNNRGARALYWLQLSFVRLGVLPFLLLAPSSSSRCMSDNFLTGRNLMNVARQSTYLTLVAMGQMLALLTGGFDLSVGTILAVTSVVGATRHGGGLSPRCRTGLALAIFVSACWPGFLAGACHRRGQRHRRRGVQRLALHDDPGHGLGRLRHRALHDRRRAGLRHARRLRHDLRLRHGSSASPRRFTSRLGCSSSVMYVVLNWTRLGRYFYAVGGNIKASRLSGINTRLFTLFMAYVICGGLAAISGLLLTARLETGEANIGAVHAARIRSPPASSPGVSLRGGVGRLSNVVLGAIFIGLVQNGMNLARIESYLQTVVIGVLLILAVVADQIRQRMIAELQD